MSDASCASAVLRSPTRHTVNSDGYHPARPRGVPGLWKCISRRLGSEAPSSAQRGALRQRHCDMSVLRSRADGDRCAVVIQGDALFLVPVETMRVTPKPSGGSYWSCGRRGAPLLLRVWDLPT